MTVLAGVLPRPPLESHPAVAVVAAAGLAGLLLAAWWIPPLATLAIWPMLFAVPGWWLVARVAPRVASPGRLGLAIVLSVAVSAHLVYWLAIATGGYGRLTIFAAAGALALPLVWSAWRRGLGGWRRAAASAVRGLNRNRLAFGLAALVTGCVGLVLDAGLWKPGPGGVVAGGSNWSDLGVHLSIAESLNAGNFPPQVPYFAGEPLVYHWFSDFHAAIAAEAAGLFAVPAFVASSALLAGALALLVHDLARTLMRDRRARRVAVTAALLVVFGGGLGWIRLVGDVASGLGDPVTLVSLHSYDNAWLTGWPYFRIPSVMGTGLLVHRATTAGLPMLVGILLLVVVGLPNARRRSAGWRDQPRLIGLAGLLGALLAPFHFFYFPIAPVLVLAWVLIGGRLRDGGTLRNAATFLAPYLLALPFALAPILQATGSGDLKLVAGWESAPWKDGLPAVAFFYVTNLGIPFALAVAALLMRRTPQRAFLAAWLAVLFVVPNVVQVSIVSFDMNKLFQAMWLAVAVLAAWLVRGLPIPAIGLVVLISAPSPLLAAAWTVTNRAQVLSWSELDAAAWMVANTPERSVFVTNGWLNSPTDPAGRLRVLTYTVYVRNLGIDPDPRAAAVDVIYCGGDPGLAAALAEQMGARYLLDTGPPRACIETVFEGSPAWALAYDAGAVRIWERVGQ